MTTTPPLTDHDQLWRQVNAGTTGVPADLVGITHLLAEVVTTFDTDSWNRHAFGSPPDGLRDAIRWSFADTVSLEAGERYAFIIMALDDETPVAGLADRAESLAQPNHRQMQRLWSGVRTTHGAFPEAHARTKSLAHFFQDDASPERVSRVEWLDAFAWRLLDLGFALAVGAHADYVPTNEDVLLGLLDLGDDDLAWAWTGAYAPVGIARDELLGVRALTAALVTWWGTRTALGAEAAPRDLPPRRLIVEQLLEAIEGPGKHRSERAWFVAAEMAGQLGLA